MSDKEPLGAVAHVKEKGKNDARFVRLPDRRWAIEVPSSDRVIRVGDLLPATKFNGTTEMVTVSEIVKIGRKTTICLFA
jgi:hypothetical protein